MTGRFICEASRFRVAVKGVRNALGSFCQCPGQPYDVRTARSCALAHVEKTLHYLGYGGLCGTGLRRKHVEALWAPYHCPQEEKSCACEISAKRSCTHEIGTESRDEESFANE